MISHELETTHRVLELNKVSKQFGSAPTVHALVDVDLSLNRGDWLSITGPSGAGKSTLLNIIGCLDRPTSGTYFIDGIDIAKLTDKQRAGLRSQRVGFVFQSFHLLPYRTVLENVMLAEVYRKQPFKGRRTRALAAIERVGLGHRADFLPMKLSGGEKQRVSIARALLGSPSLLLCDEPTGNLDSKSSTALLDVFEKLNQDGLTLVIVTHDENVAMRATRRVHVVDGFVTDATGGEKRIPFKIRSGLGFFEQAHIKDIVSYLHAILNPLDEISWTRILKLTPGIGNITARKIWDALKTTDNPIESIRSDRILKELPERGKEHWTAFNSNINGLEQEHVLKYPSETIRQLLVNGYDEYLKNNYKNYDERREDIELLAYYSNNFTSTKDFLSDTALLTNVQAEVIMEPSEEGESKGLTTSQRDTGLERNKSTDSPVSAVNTTVARSGITARDLLNEALAGMFARPGRMMLTVLGIVIGLTALVATLGLTRTAGNRIISQFDQLAATELFVKARPGRTTGIVDPKAIPWDAPTRLGRLNGVVAVGMISEVDVGGAMISSSPVKDPLNQSAFKLAVYAASPELFRAVRAELKTGQLPDLGHSNRADRVAVLGPDAALRLGITGLKQLPSIYIGDYLYLVVGILHDVARKPELLGSVIIPEGTARHYFGLAGPGTVVVETKIGAAYLIANQAPSALRPDNPRILKLMIPQEPRRVRDEVQTDLDVMFLMLGALSLVVGAIGIANITLVGVMERTGEIGLRRAIGATRGHIASQFLFESASMGVIGGIIGASVGILIVVAVSAYQVWTPVLDPVVPILAPLVGGVIGLLSGTYPALRAAHLEPVEAFRTT